MVEKGKGNIQFDIKVEGLERLQNAFQRAPEIVGREVQQALNLATTKVQAEARKEAPVKTGYLRKRILFTVEPFRGIVESKAEYGIYVHEGTRPHDIYPVKKPVLADKKKKIIYGKHVYHPGFKGNPFMERGAKNAESDVQKIFQKAVENITNQLAK